MTSDLLLDADIAGALFCGIVFGLIGFILCVAGAGGIGFILLLVSAFFFWNWRRLCKKKETRQKMLDDALDVIAEKGKIK